MKDTDLQTSEPEKVKQRGVNEKISRRKMLSILSVAGVTLAGGSTFMRTIASGTSVTDSVYGGGKEKPDLPLCVAATIESLRAGTQTRLDYLYYVTNPGQEGIFRYDPSDTVSGDNTGTILVAANGNRFKRIYANSLLASWFGTKADGVTVDTAALQSALQAAAGKKLIIPKQQANYYLTGQLYIPSNIVLEFESGTVLQAIDTLRITAPYERLIRILDAKNVVVIGNGATLRMNKLAYPNNEQAHIFDISGSENVVIGNIQANDSGGDGFYIGAFESVNTYCKNIVLRNCKANNNRRQGLSVISVAGLLVENCRFTSTNGTAPQSGVDIEPNKSTEKLSNIRFLNCVAEGNTGRGYLVNLVKLNSLSGKVDIVFQNCRTGANSFGYSMNYGLDVKGDIKLIDCRAENEQYAGFSDLSFSPGGVRRTYVRCIAYNCNTANLPEDPYGYGSSFIVTTVPQQVRTSIGNVYYYDCEAIDDRQPPLMARGFSTKQNNNEIIQDVRYYNCSASGVTSSEFSITPASTLVTVSHIPQKSVPFTSSGTLNLNYSGYKITNRGSSGTVELILPKATANCSFTFLVEAAYALQINTQQGESIWTPIGGITNVMSESIGASISLLGRDDGIWEVTTLNWSWFG
ncbi:right-handed parallel beta-helix repeat-containing protein [Paenibacillus nasutitermitis]|uniref:Right handed beta helix domain-containing protein n=1 Tax=Paenibacillus nasutitermitis TaxID=1652958 RepID=A0A916ZE35_9BACL|nr:right-handed parallel beta-helix repeat-containing protein [Paenibacillus nasutitermitis]GGD89311.1 hypothetical protein GCM10010911_54890 [Paenibacillus nasutitermitis]